MFLNLQRRGIEGLRYILAEGYYKMIAKEWIEKVFGYIDDVNVKEIGSQISNNNLQSWIETWGYSFKNIISEIERYYEKSKGWILLKENAPNEEQMVQILVYDDHFDYPDTYSDFGFRIKTNENILDDIWIVNNEKVCGEVIAWKPVHKPLSVKELKELGWLK